MSTGDLEIELKRWRSEGKGDLPPSNALRVSVEEALDYRNSGNLPDAENRTLRLVLVITEADVARLGELRLRYEPDYHEPPTWRSQGSKPVNVVPLRTNEIDAEARRAGVAPLEAGEIEAEEPRAWWEVPNLAELEDEWSRTGAVAGVTVPGPYRGFVYKTVLGLRAAGREVTAEAIAGSIARWVPRGEGERIREALLRANPRN